MAKTYSSVSIVIPVYNEQNLIKKILAKVNSAKVSGLDKEIIVVDDGSLDGTTAILKSLRMPGLKKVFLSPNRGKGVALRAGFKIARGDIVIVQDADLEYNPDDYPILLSPILAGSAQVVYGSRELKINMHSYPLFFIGGKLVTFVTKLLFGGKLTDVPTGYKVFDRQILSRLPLRCQRFEFCPEVTALLLARRTPIVEVPIRYAPRSIAQGKKIKWQDGIEAILTLGRVRIGL